MSWPRTGQIVVVKIGGSLAADRSRLDQVIDALATASSRVVIVPGGGPFADAVRTAQGALGFSDRLAHGQALGAMSLFAEVLADLYRSLVMASTRGDVEAAHAAGKVPVFRMDRLMSGGGGIPEGWHVTSDSIAAWLAFELSAAGLVLVKSADGPHLAGAAALAADGLVDEAFPTFASRLTCPVRLVGPGALSRLADVVASPAARVGTSVTG
ncbi:uridylate kinase [Chthonobacter rhizosphaerae]|uniref:amino acid kinase family protein n=1 Tax=Chthonobacter rhizosphaerae TaxID=2735553 RepID=UPI0031B60652